MGFVYSTIFLPFWTRESSLVLCLGFCLVLDPFFNPLSTLIGIISPTCTQLCILFCLLLCFDSCLGFCLEFSILSSAAKSTDSFVNQSLHHIHTPSRNRIYKLNFFFDGAASTLYLFVLVARDDIKRYVSI